MTELGISVDVVNDCIAKSFEDEGDYSSYNDMLYDDREAAIDLGIQLNPSLTINSQIYNGPMKGEEIFKSICSAYHHHSIPEVCEPKFDIQQALGHMNDFQPPKYGR